VRADAHAVRDADEDHDGKKYRGQLQRPRVAGVKAVAHDNLQKGQQRHQREHDDDNQFLDAVENFHDHPPVTSRINTA